MKVLSAVRYSGKTHWSHELQFVDCDVLVAKAIGWPKHFGKKSNIRGAKNFKCEETDDHEIAKNAVSNINDSEAAYRASKRKSLSLNKNDFPSFEQKLLGYLHRRGFNEYVSAQTVNTLWKETKNTNEILQETY